MAIREMAQQLGWPTALFALKCYIAGMMALYFAMWIGLERPYWALLTSFIVAQPLAGAVISKALYRVIGTMIGAAATVFMVPPLSNSPELLTVVLAAWLALCAFIAFLDRTPRSYMFVLAGYSASMIFFPSVDMPGHIFTVAVLRVQEITVGILCGSLVHGFFFPGSVTALLFRRVDAILRDAEGWSRDAIALEPVEGLDAERRRLAADINELFQLSQHLPWETVRLSPRVRTVRALQNQLSEILPLSAAVEDRIERLRRDGRPLSPRLAALVADTRAWLAEPGEDPVTMRRAADGLRARCSALEPDPLAAPLEWQAMMELSLLSRLSLLIAAHRDCRDIREQMHSYSRRPVTPRVAQLLAETGAPVLHRDYAGSARLALAAFVTVLLGSALWIGSGWKDGFTAVMLASVFLSLFASFENPVVLLRGMGIGMVISTFVAGFYCYVIMPQIDGFPMLAAVWAPFMIACFAFMTSRRWAGVAMQTMVGVASPGVLELGYVNQFPMFMNGAIAQLLGVMFGIMMTRLTRTAWPEKAVRRTARATWRDIADMSLAATPANRRDWTARMLDRLALLTPRLAATGDRTIRSLIDAVRELRTGLAVSELGALRASLPQGQARPALLVLREVNRHYTAMPGGDGPPESLLRRIDLALRHLSGHPRRSVRRDAILALTGLRCNLFPEADDYRRAA